MENKKKSDNFIKKNIKKYSRKRITKNKKKTHKNLVDGGGIFDMLGMSSDVTSGISNAVGLMGGPNKAMNWANTIGQAASSYMSPQQTQQQSLGYNPLAWAGKGFGSAMNMIPGSSALKRGICHDVSKPEAVNTILNNQLIKTLAAAGGWAVSHPRTIQILGKATESLMKNDTMKRNITELSEEINKQLNNTARSAGDLVAQGLITGSEKTGEVLAKASARFQDYMEKLNDEYMPDNKNIQLDNVILGRYGLNINKAYQGLQGYEREMDPHLKIVEKDLINNSYRKFAELQWRSEIADIETKVNKPYYDDEEDQEIKRKIWEKMTVAFANKTAQLAIQTFEVSFKNDLVFSSNPCDLEYFKHLGRQLSLAQYNMFSVAKEASNKDVTYMMNLPYKVFIYKLWFLCCLHCNYNPYINDNPETEQKVTSSSYALLPEYLMNNLGYFEDFTDIINSKGLDKDVFNTVKLASRVFPLKDKGSMISSNYKNPLNPIPKALTEFRTRAESTRSVFGNSEERVKESNRATMKVCYKVSQLVIDKFAQSDLNDWDRLITVTYALKIVIYITLFVFWRVELNSSTTKGKSKWLEVIKSKGKENIEVTDILKFTNHVILFNKLKKAIEMEGIKYKKNDNNQTGGGSQQWGGDEGYFAYSFEQLKTPDENLLDLNKLLGHINSIPDIESLDDKGMYQQIKDIKELSVDDEILNFSITNQNLIRLIQLKFLKKPELIISDKEPLFIPSPKDLQTEQMDLGEKYKLYLVNVLYESYPYLFFKEANDVKIRIDTPPNTDISIGDLIVNINQENSVNKIDNTEMNGLVTLFSKMSEVSSQTPFINVTDANKCSDGGTSSVSEEKKLISSAEPATDDENHCLDKRDLGNIEAINEKVQEYKKLFPIVLMSTYYWIRFKNAYLDFDSLSDYKKIKDEKIKGAVQKVQEEMSRFTGNNTGSDKNSRVLNNPSYKSMYKVFRSKLEILSKLFTRICEQKELKFNNYKGQVQAFQSQFEIMTLTGQLNRSSYKERIVSLFERVAKAVLGGTKIDKNKVFSEGIKKCISSLENNNQEQEDKDKKKGDLGCIMSIVKDVSDFNILQALETGDIIDDNAYISTLLEHLNYLPKSIQHNTLDVIKKTFFGDMTDDKELMKEKISQVIVQKINYHVAVGSDSKHLVDKPFEISNDGCIVYYPLEEDKEKNETIPGTIPYAQKNIAKMVAYYKFCKNPYENGEPQLDIPQEFAEFIRDVAKKHLEMNPSQDDTIQKVLADILKETVEDEDKQDLKLKFRHLCMKLNIHDLSSAGMLQSKLESYAEEKKYQFSFEFDYPGGVVGQIERKGNEYILMATVLPKKCVTSFYDVGHVPKNLFYNLGQATDGSGTLTRANTSNILSNYGVNQDTTFVEVSDEEIKAGAPTDFKEENTFKDKDEKYVQVLIQKKTDGKIQVSFQKAGTKVEPLDLDEDFVENFDNLFFSEGKKEKQTFLQWLWSFGRKQPDTLGGGGGGDHPDDLKSKLENLEDEKHLQVLKKNGFFFHIRKTPSATSESKATGESSAAGDSSATPESKAAAESSASAETTYQLYKSELPMEIVQKIDEIKDKYYEPLFTKDGNEYTLNELIDYLTNWGLDLSRGFVNVPEVPVTLTPNTKTELGIATPDEYIIIEFELKDGNIIVTFLDSVTSKENTKEFILGEGLGKIAYFFGFRDKREEEIIQEIRERKDRLTLSISHYLNCSVGEELEVKLKPQLETVRNSVNQKIQAFSVKLGLSTIKRGQTMSIELQFSKLEEIFQERLEIPEQYRSYIGDCFYLKKLQIVHALLTIIKNNQSYFEKLVKDHFRSSEQAVKTEDKQYYFIINTYTKMLLEYNIEENGEEKIESSSDLGPNQIKYGKSLIGKIKELKKEINSFLTNSNIADLVTLGGLLAVSSYAATHAAYSLASTVLLGAVGPLVSGVGLTAVGIATLSTVGVDRLLGRSWGTTGTNLLGYAMGPVKKKLTQTVGTVANTVKGAASGAAVGAAGAAGLAGVLVLGGFIDEDDIVNFSNSSFDVLKDVLGSVPAFRKTMSSVNHLLGTKDRDAQVANNILNFSETDRNLFGNMLRSKNQDELEIINQQLPLIVEAIRKTSHVSREQRMKKTVNVNSITLANIETQLILLAVSLEDEELANKCKHDNIFMNNLNFVIDFENRAIYSPSQEVEEAIEKIAHQNIFKRYIRLNFLFNKKIKKNILMKHLGKNTKQILEVYFKLNNDDLQILKKFLKYLIPTDEDELKQRENIVQFMIDTDGYYKAKSDLIHYLGEIPFPVEIKSITQDATKGSLFKCTVSDTRTSNIFTKKEYRDTDFLCPETLNDAQIKVLKTDERLIGQEGKDKLEDRLGKYTNPERDTFIPYLLTQNQQLLGQDPQRTLNNESILDFENMSRQLIAIILELQTELGSSVEPAKANMGVVFNAKTKLNSLYEQFKMTTRLRTIYTNNLGVLFKLTGEQQGIYDFFKQIKSKVQSTGGKLSSLKKRKKILKGGADGDPLKITDEDLKDFYKKHFGESEMERQNLPFDNQTFTDQQQLFVDKAKDASGKKGLTLNDLEPNKKDNPVIKALKDVKDMAEQTQKELEKEEAELNKQIQEMGHDNIRENSGDLQYMEAREIDDRIQPGFYEDRDFGGSESDSLLQKGSKFLKKAQYQAMDVRLPEQIYDKTSTLEIVRTNSVKLITSSVSEIGESANIVCSMVFMSAETQIIDYNDNVKENSTDIEKEKKYGHSNVNANFLQNNNSRGFRSYDNRLWKNSADLVRKGTDFVSSFASSAVQTAGEISGYQGFAAALTNKSISVSKSLDKLIDARRTKHYFPILASVVCEVEKISSSEYIIRVLNTENEMFFADFSENYVRPVFKLTMLGNRCIYSYYTTLLDNSNPYLKEQQYGMTAYYLGTPNSWLPFEDSSYTSFGVQRCEVLFYPLTPQKLFKQSSKSQFKPNFWSMCMEQLVTTYDPTYIDKKDMVLRRLATQRIKNVDPHTIDISRKKSFEKIIEHDFKDKFNYIEYAGQQILESAYTDNKKELSPIIRDMIVQFYNNHFKSMLFNTVIEDNEINDKFEILVGYSESQTKRLEKGKHDKDKKAITGETIADFPEKLYFFKKSIFVEININPNKKLRMTGGSLQDGGMFNFFKGLMGSKSTSNKKKNVDEKSKDRIKAKIELAVNKNKNNVDIINVNGHEHTILLEPSSGDKYKIKIYKKEKGKVYNSKDLLKETDDFVFLNFTNGSVDKKKIEKWQKQFAMLSDYPEKYKLINLLQKISKDTYNKPMKKKRRLISFLS